VAASSNPSSEGSTGMGHTVGTMGEKIKNQNSNFKEDKTQ
jgi:hypothetical protein